MSNKIEELNTQIAELTAMGDALLKSGKRWRAKKGGVFHYVSDNGSTGCMADPKSVFADANGFYQIGNYFRTESEAQRVLERMIATQQLKDRIAELNAEQGWVADWCNADQKKSYFRYSSVDKFMDIGTSNTMQSSSLEFYGSRETIETVISEMPEQIKIWMGVE